MPGYPTRTMYPMILQEDGVRLSYLLKGGQKVLEEVVRIVQFMFENGADTWEDALRSGVVVPLYKKGDMDDPGNYRGVCLLSLGSRILARVDAARLQIWAEDVGLFDDNQQGFRKGRSTADASQIMMRLKEDAEDLEKRMEGQEVKEEDKLAARLLDLRKAYPRVNKPALCRLLERYGLGGNFLRSLMDLHETTEYKVRGKDGCSETWMPERGLREGCPSSPPLFNIYHQAVMRVAAKERERKAEENGLVAGIVMKWVPGSAFPSEGTWEKENSEAVEVIMEKNLFADDTTVIGDQSELEAGVKTTKEVMEWFEEANNDGKEEILELGSGESGKIRMLGSWMGWKEDLEERIKRGKKAWWIAKKRLKGAKISKRQQARIVETSVESTMLFDCHVRTWRVGEIKRLQQVADKAYRYIWSSKNKPPLRQMEEEGVNRIDVRRILKVKSIRMKIEKRVLERIGHVMRMEDGRLVKTAVLGWVEKLERWERRTGGGRRRKTVLYWKKLLKEAAIDYTRIGRLTANRKVWKARIKERMKQIEEWEASKGKRWTGGEKIRDATVEERMEFVFVCEVCGKVCKSKGGLTIHRKRMHEVSAMKKSFQCERCKEIFSQEANLRNHEKACSGAGGAVNHMRKCDICLRDIGKKSFARHRRACATTNGVEDTPRIPGPSARVYKGRRENCPSCGRKLAATNMSRHLKICQQ